MLEQKKLNLCFLQVPLHEYLLSVLDEKYVLFVKTTELMINLASLHFLLQLDEENL